MDEHAFASATRLAGEIRDRRIGCLELLDHYLARAERYNPALNAVVAWQVDQARERARAADAALARGEVWGPLHGVPMTVKESFDGGRPADDLGQPAWKDNLAAGNAVVVERLLAAGAVVYGKTNVPLLLMDSQSYNEVYGTTNNPWDTARGPGGSSGGEAAALAAGLSALGAGSDIAGSLRNPAHYCGVYGHKPSWGIVPMRGHSAAGTLTPTDISVVGPMARLRRGSRTGDARSRRPGCRCSRRVARRIAGAAASPARRFPGRAVARLAAVRDRRQRARALRRWRQRSMRRARRSTRRLRPPIDDAAHHQLFMMLLRAATAARMSDEDFAAQREIAAGLIRPTQSQRAQSRAARRCRTGLGRRQRGAHAAALRVGPAVPARRRAADADRRDGRLSARPQSRPRPAA